MTGSNSYRDLVVWQQAMDVAEAVYHLTAKFPAEERYGMAAQMRRAAVSVPSNIAEGQGRNSRGEFLQFLGTAKGSLCELETQLSLAQRLGYLSKERWNALQGQLDSVSRLLNGLMGSLKAKAASTRN